MTPDEFAERRRILEADGHLAQDYARMLDDVERLRGLLAEAHELVDDCGREWLCKCGAWGHHAYQPHAAHVAKILDGS